LIKLLLVKKQPTSVSRWAGVYHLKSSSYEAIVPP